MFLACDISGKLKKDRYLVIGSTWIQKQQLPEYEKAVSSFRLKNNLWGELKWTKITSQKINEYKDFLTLSLTKFNFETKVIVRDRKISIPRDRFSSKEELISTFYFLLLSRHLVRILKIKPNINSFEILFDKGDLEKQILNLKFFLNHSLNRLNLKKSFHLCECDSKICSAVQLCDLITGAVSTKLSNPWSSIAKSQQDIIQHIEKLLKYKLDNPTLPSATTFNLWIWRPSAKQ